VDWLSVDGGAIPSWAEGKRGLVLGEEGLAHVSGREATVARWNEVLGVVEAPERDRLWVLVPRRPPEPPWIEVSDRELPEGLGSVTETVRAIETRLARSGYRQTSRASRPLLPKEELWKRVVSREAIPGALEVPPRNPVATRVPGLNGITFLLLAFFMYGGPMLGMPLVRGDGFGLLLLMLPMWVLGIVVIHFQRKWMKARAIAKAPRKRVLVLAPDACVVGFTTGPRALDWDEVGGFRTELRMDGEEYLVVDGVDGRPLGAIDARWFGAPVDLIVRVASRYRERR